MSFDVRYRILKGISNMLCHMSYDRILSIGRFLGPCIMNRIAKQRNRGLEQIMTGLKVSRPEAEKLLQKVYENIGMSAMEMMYMPRLCKEKAHIDDFVKIDHPEYLEEAYAEKKGIVGLTAHMGNWEWLGAGLALHGYDTSAIGKKQAETDGIGAGDIGAVAKLVSAKTGDTLCDPKNIVKLHGMDYAQPCYSRAISPKTKQEIEKLGTGLNKLNEEDPTFHVVNNAETHQTVISGAGDIQIDVLCAKLKSRFGVDAELSAPRVAYREKIRSTVRKQGRYKKQTGGSGQFGDVHIIFEPQNEQEDMIFEENVFGGSVPKNYFPAVEKGLRESCLHGVLAGYPVVFLKATLVDGSYHPVDSSEIAFKLAANLAFKAALPEAKPVLMEPIGELKVTIPDSYLGDVMGDLNKRRGRVMGMNPTGDGETVLEAEVPMAEMMSYAIDLRSMTQSRGTFTFNFVRYEDCPAAAQEKAIAEAKALAEAE